VFFRPSIGRNGTGVVPFNGKLIGSFRLNTTVGEALAGLEELGQSVEVPYTCDKAKEEKSSLPLGVSLDSIAGGDRELPGVRSPLFNIDKLKLSSVGKKLYNWFNKMNYIISSLMAEFGTKDRTLRIIGKVFTRIIEVARDASFSSYAPGAGFEKNKKLLDQHLSVFSSAGGEYREALASYDYLWSTHSSQLER